MNEMVFALSGRGPSVFHQSNQVGKESSSSSSSEMKDDAIVTLDDDSDTIIGIRMKENDDDAGDVEDDVSMGSVASCSSSHYHHRHSRMSMSAQKEMKLYQRGYHLTRCLNMILLLLSVAIKIVAVIVLPNTGTTTEDEDDLSDDRVSPTQRCFHHRIVVLCHTGFFFLDRRTHSLLHHYQPDYHCTHIVRL
jgi:hypothetical protein